MKAQKSLKNKVSLIEIYEQFQLYSIKRTCAWLPVEVDFADHIINLTLYFFRKEIIIAKKEEGK